MAFGMGFGMAQRTSVIAAVVPTEEIGIASSILALGRNIAGAFGIAVFGTILTDSTNSNVLSLGYKSTVKLSNPQIYRQAVELIILKAQIDAYRTVFISAGIVLLIGTALSLLIRVSKERMRQSHGGEEVFVEA